MTKWEVGKMYYTVSGLVAKVTEVTEKGYKGEVYYPFRPGETAKKMVEVSWFKNGCEFVFDHVGRYNLSPYQARYTP